jgi:hypothetical protein
MSSGIASPGLSMGTSMPPFIRTNEGEILNPNHILSAKNDGKGTHITISNGDYWLTTETSESVDEFAKNKLKMDIIA